jgi:hypothetical protein
LQLLHRVKGLIEIYKEEKRKYLNEFEDKDPEVVKQYETGDNLLSFLPVSIFYG